MLKDEFGEPDILIGKLYDRLQRLPPAGADLCSVKATHETIEAILQQLETQGKFYKGNVWFVGKFRRSTPRLWPPS